MPPTRVARELTVPARLRLGSQESAWLLFQKLRTLFEAEYQMVRQDHRRVLCQDCGALEHLLQLAYIAGPAISLEHLLGADIKPQRLLPAEPRQKMGRK